MLARLDFQVLQVQEGPREKKEREVLAEKEEVQVLPGHQEKEWVLIWLLYLR